MDLKHQLKIVRDRLVFRYASYVSCVCECVRNTGATAEQLRTFLLDLPAFSPEDSTQHCKLFPGSKIDYDVTDSVYTLFAVISLEYASYLSYDLFQVILDWYCSEGECDSVKLKYPGYLKQYIEQHKILEFVEVHPELERCTGASKIVKVETGIKSTCSIARLVQLRNDIAALLDLEPYVLRLHRIDDSHMIVAYLIPTLVADAVFADGRKWLERRERFRSYSVRWLKCDDLELNFENEPPL